MKNCRELNTEQGKFSEGKGGTKTCNDSNIGWSCVRASVTEARVMVFVCVHVAKECVDLHVCERKDVHANCSKMLAAQQKKGYALAELWGTGILQGWESKVSRKVTAQLRLQNGEPKASSLPHGGNGWSLVFVRPRKAKLFEIPAAGFAKYCTRNLWYSSLTKKDAVEIVWVSWIIDRPGVCSCSLIADSFQADTKKTSFKNWHLCIRHS